MQRCLFQRSVLLIATALGVALSANGQPNELADRLRQHVQVLASPKLEGREPATTGNEQAARYIAEQFQAIGVAPLGSDYFQRFSIASRIELEGTNSVHIRMLLERPGIPRSALKPVQIAWKPLQDYVPLGISDTGTITAPVVFCGFGSPQTNGTIDFAGIGRQGKSDIVLPGERDHYHPHEASHVTYRYRRRQAPRAGCP